tara:strand:- start:1053 stop:1223 length:171 start_codon:yes stop_codon:yes gene_type:complete
LSISQVYYLTSFLIIDNAAHFILQARFSTKDGKRIFSIFLYIGDLLLKASSFNSEE